MMSTYLGSLDRAVEREPCTNSPARRRCTRVQTFDDRCVVEFLGIPRRRDNIWQGCDSTEEDPFTLINAGFDFVLRPIERIDN